MGAHSYEQEKYFCYSSLFPSSSFFRNILASLGYVESVSYYNISCFSMTLMKYKCQASSCNTLNGALLLDSSGYGRMRISPRSCSYLPDTHKVMKIRWVTKKFCRHLRFYKVMYSR
ncbi:hypothetical protein Agabi119p4_3880 [Agaricus bisporus var. burnettii]|uniref:Uncharacterized protein n=1 Tax=Agaricus bisporus var. burnettii TaxID=192524 RepID=A0A8H7F5I4_AGABI|nr:hypothetical protein Agabi119p4_3880 [Agaricus bisporus var. burnettii]